MVAGSYNDRYNIIFWHSYLLGKTIKWLIMTDNENKYPEPPELRKQGIPPLKKIVKYLFIGIAVAFIIVLIFSIIFKLRN